VAQFPILKQRPVLIRSDNELFSVDDYAIPSNATTRRRGGRLSEFVPGPSVNVCRTRVLENLRGRLDEIGEVRILVVGGGRQRAQLDPVLKATKPHCVVYSDIDAKADVDLFCDAHELPFHDKSFDALITTAVLEHVMYPERVASELARVIKPGGLLYSELPFMQQVHEGAYDFTRYTLSGHRRLFSSFHEIDAGLVAGPATAFVWALENLVLACVSAPQFRLVSKFIVRLAFGWIKYLDYLLKDKPEAMDGASCTFFLGAKSDCPVPAREIVARYVGAKHISHT
jgi:SAM-dependent methyltransferase